MKSRSFFLAAVWLVWPVLAAAAALPLPNPQFRDWDSARGLPAQWQPALYGYGARQLCERPAPAPCAVQLQAPVTPLPGRFASLSQDLPVGSAAGHWVTLSGRIRTQALQNGWAGLFASVHAKGRAPLAFKNSAATPARGNARWRTFRLRLPVAANADTLRIGVLMTGGGSAWFSDLKLEVDARRRVPPADLATFARVSAFIDDAGDPRIPPRPQASQTLLSDAALALPGTAMPAVPAAWQEDMRKHQHAFRSLFSEDYTDLAFLAPLLAQRRLIQLGESSHGIAEFNWAKVRLIKYLHEVLGFDVIAFESPMTSCDAAGETLAEIGAEAAMRQCLFRVWQTEEVLPLFTYLRNSQNSARPLRLTGFDPQAGRQLSAATERFRVLLALVNPSGIPALQQNEAMLMQWKDADLSHLLAYYTGLQTTLEQQRALLLQHLAAHPDWVELGIQEARSRVAYVRMLAAPDQEGTAVRDQAMAENLHFLLNTKYPGKKMIVWGHNAHIAYAPEQADDPMPMGAWLAKGQRRDSMYTLGLFMGRGAGAQANRQVYEILPPDSASIEAILASGGLAMSWIDFSWSQHTQHWPRLRLPARSWGITTFPLVPAESFDGVLYLDTVSPPRFFR